ncbi:hypothetical protein Tco_1019747 [Tanacetum coccineum]|uniref:Uncharacterized protein n=1 Tax=Tanacetum coccineum TaxID=301880 RepID=A0ABQ5FY63_9ASTR
MLLCYEPDTAYGLHPIRRISDESALAVEIDFTWSLGFGYVEPGRAPIPLSSRISLIMFEFSSCLFADSDMNLGAVRALWEHTHDHTQCLDALPPTLVTDIDRDVRELYTRSGAVRDVIFSQRYRLRSLEREYDDHRLIHDMLVQQAAMQRKL